VVREVWVSPLLPHLRRVLVSQQPERVVEVGGMQLAAEAVAPVSPLRDMQQEPSQRQSGRGA